MRLLIGGVTARAQTERVKRGKEEHVAVHTRTGVG